MAEEQKQACNRTPFKSTSSCDRGQVDIDAFTSLPICKKISPTKPRAGVPSIDFPVIPFTPPPCACVNIITSASGIIEDRENLEFDTNFKAIGDCCEGNYKENFSLKIPCVAFDLIGGNDAHPVGITMNVCDDQTLPTGNFNLGITKDKCTLRINPEIQLNLPRPPIYDFNTSFDLKTLCGLSSAYGEFKFDRGGDLCSRNIKAKLTLNIPKPHKYTFKGDLKLNTVCDISSASGDFSFIKDSNGCDTDLTANLVLNIPKPKKYNFTTSCDVRRTCYSKGWDSYGDSTNIFWVTEESESGTCEKSFVHHLKLDIPCIQFELSGADVSHEFDISYDSTPKGSLNLKAQIDCCKIKLNPKIKLTIPNPKGYEFSTELFINTRCGSGGAKGTFQIITGRGNSPGTKKIKSRLELNIPTPPVYEFHVGTEFLEGEWSYGLAAENITVVEQNCTRIVYDNLSIRVPHVANIRMCRKVNKVNGRPNEEFNLPDWALNNDTLFQLSGGIDGSASFTLGETEDSFGFVTGLCPSIRLTMPCPLKKLKLVGESQDPPSDRPYITVTQEPPSSSGCAAKWKASLMFPEPLYTGELKILTGFYFTGTEFEPYTCTLKFLNGMLSEYECDEEEPTIDVTFAEHTCCDET